MKLNPLPAIMIHALLLLVPAVAAEAAHGWTREGFLGDRANNPTVARLVQAARTNREFGVELLKPKTDEARAALLRIAYGDLGLSGRANAAAFAANCYVTSLGDKSEARALLIATNTEVVVCGLRTLAGQPVDRELLERLKLLLLVDSAQIRGAASTVLRKEANKALATEKVDAILKSMSTIEACEDAARGVLVGEPFFFHPWTWAEIALDSQVQALVSLGDGRSRDFTDFALARSGLARDYAVIAGATLGDETARRELRELIRHAQSVWARIAALKLLLVNPSPEDLDAVRKVAAGDTFQAAPMPAYFRMSGADHSLEGKNDARIYPLRFLADQELRRYD